eukprot:1147520-Alexandrium_andersonii.AAC.1
MGTAGVELHDAAAPLAHPQWPRTCSEQAVELLGRVETLRLRPCNVAATQKPSKPKPVYIPFPRSDREAATLSQ